MELPRLLRTLGPALIAGVIMALLTAGSEPAAQRTLTVCPAGCDFSTIQAAIDAARPGDMIEVQAGTYRENLMITNKRDLTLQGAGYAAVTLDGSAAANREEIVPGILIENSQDITIRGFRIIGSRRGLQAENTTGLLIADNLFEDNLRAAITIGVGPEQVEQVQLLNNIVWNTQVDRDGAYGIGIDIFGSQATLEGNTIEGNADCGLRVTHSGERPGRATGHDNVIQDNRGGDLCGAVPLTLLAAPPPAGTLDAVAVPQDVPTLQEALAQVKPGGTITVAAGTYRGQLQIYKSVTIRGAGPEQTVLQAPGPDWTAVNIATASPVVTIEGLTVTGGRRGMQIDTGPSGRVTLRDVNIDRNGAGGRTDVGLLVFGQGEVTLERASISNNRGQGVWVFGQPRVTVRDAMISGNTGHGIFAIGKATLQVEGSTVSRNELRGIGLFNDTRAVIERSTIESNGGFSGIVVRDEAEATISESTIRGNVESGIWVGDSARVEVRDNRITDNRANAQGNFGWGIALRFSAQATLEENTISGHPLSGIAVGAPDLNNEAVQAEISRNRIQNNRECGVWADRDPRIRITGRRNTISGNRLGNLCGNLSKFPQGFGGGG